MYQSHCTGGASWFPSAGHDANSRHCSPSTTCSLLILPHESAHSCSDASVLARRISRSLLSPPCAGAKKLVMPSITMSVGSVSGGSRWMTLPNLRSSASLFRYFIWILPAPSPRVLALCSRGGLASIASLLHTNMTLALGSLLATLSAC